MGGVETEAQLVEQPGRDGVECVVWDVDDLAAGVALDVGVLVGDGGPARSAGTRSRLRGIRPVLVDEVVHRARTAEVDVREKAGIAQRGERSVHRSPVDAGLERRDAGAHLVGGEVLLGAVGRVEDAQHGMACWRDALSAPAQRRQGVQHSWAGLMHRGRAALDHAPIVSRTGTKCPASVGVPPSTLGA